MSIKYKKQYKQFVLFFLTILLMAGCSQESSAISLVQNSKASYGRVYDFLYDLDANHTIQKMPGFKDATDKYFTNQKWTSFESEDGRIYVNFEGKLNFLGISSNYLFQWTIEGDIDAGTARPYFNGLEINGEQGNEEVFDAINVTMLYELNVLNAEEYSFLIMLMALDSLLF